MSIPNRIAVLNADGTTDTSFNPGGLNAEGLCVVCLAGGRIVAGGAFTGAAGQGRARLAVFESTGALVNTSLSAGGTVRALAVQTDGKVLVGGSFQTLGGLARIRLARLRADMTVEPAYEPSSNGAVYAIATQDDGKTVIGGGFTGISGQARSHLARLLNDAAPQSLAVLSASTVRWLRGGSSAETMRVTFETDTGGGYAPSGGTVARIAGGWEVTGLALSGAGDIRARAWPHASGVIEEIVSYDVVPEISVSSPAGDIADGGELAFGNVQTGKTLDIVITITNTGLDDLTLTGGTPATLSGTHAAQWSIVAQPASPITPGTSASFILRFTPTSEGAKTAALTIASDDADEASYNIDLTGTATAGVGSVDASYMPVVIGRVATLSLSSEMKMGGAFTVLNGLNRNRFARLSLAGVAQSQSGTGANGTVWAVLQLPDGKWMIGGEFSTVHGVARSRLARLNADGSLDTTFNRPVVGGAVRCLALQPNGAVLVGGAVTSIGGISRSLARINADGTMDSAFVPDIEGFTYHIQVQPDGKIVLGGTFRIITRLNANGSRDAAFTLLPGVSFCDALAVQADGKIIAGTEDGLIRLNTDGTADGGWTTTNRDVRALAIQADGLVVAGGGSIRRYLTTGAQDTSFADCVAWSVWALGLQADGQVVVGGDSITSAARTLVRLLNDPATSALTTTASRVQWLRGGAMQEAQWTVFDLSEDGGTSWTRLGTGTRISGGWELAGISLPQAGRIRGRAFVGGALQDEALVFAGLAVADISIERGTTVLSDGGTTAFTGRIVGQSVDVTLTIRNTGGATLSGLVAVASGEFSVTSLGATSLEPGQTTTLIVRFTPSAVGARSGVLSVTSNVPGSKSPFGIVLTGSGITTPTATTTSATLITSTQARLRSSIKANDDTAKAFVEYKRTIDSVWIRSAETSVAGFTAVALNFDITGLTGLTPSTAYHYRAGIYNNVTTSAAPVFGGTVAFNTTA